MAYDIGEHIDAYIFLKRAALCVRAPPTAHRVMSRS